MARTIRRFVRGTGRDGQRDWTTIIRRDSRATGLRDHRHDRRAARISLRVDAEDTVAAGKRRRYSERYGTYEY